MALGDSLELALGLFALCAAVCGGMGACMLAACWLVGFSQQPQLPHPRRRALARYRPRRQESGRRD